MSEDAGAPEGGAPAIDERNRKLVAAEAALSPLSLCGSWFHHDSFVGLIVGEVQPGIYLCEVHTMHPVERHDWWLGASEHQQLIKVDQMMDWRFFDNESWMRTSFQKYRKEIEAS